MITVSSAMQQENIKKLLESIENEAITYKFKEKKGIQLIFEITGDKDAAIRLAKDAIKAEEWGKVLYFNVA
jgi:chorismate mutase